jgi:aspartyl-tRNA(Asn)/glutamyl-tRNA(Gln) amidotransferase subunit A
MSELASTPATERDPEILTIKDAGAALRDGTTSATALTQELLDRTARLNPALGAFVVITGEAALEQAAAADADLAAGDDRGPLQGIPLAIKDIIAMKGAPTTANSRVLAPGWGGDTDAPVVARLREAGSVFLGKSTTSEFAIGLPDPETGFLVPHNPWNLVHTPAGSSSGTGIAVAAGLALGGLGTDTGGSVRSPAAVNGHTGLKVTFGRVPKSGVVPLAFSLDSVGPMARSAWDCAAMLEVMAGYDASDPNAARQDVPRYTELLDGDVEGMRIALPIPYFFDHEMLHPQMRDAVLGAVGHLVDAGAVSREVDLPYGQQAKDANSIILAAEAYAYHRDNLVRRWQAYGVGTRPTLARGAFYTAADLVQAQRFRSMYCRMIAQLLQDHDVIVTPSAPGPAEVATELTPSRRLVTPQYTAPWNLTGLPAVAVPVGFSSAGLPLSMQVVGRPFAEATVLRLADALQRMTDWHLAVPPVHELVPAAA